MCTARNLALRWSISKGARTPLFCCLAGVEDAPFAQAGGVVAAPFFCLARGEDAPFCCLAGGEDAPLLSCRGRGRPPFLSCRGVAAPLLKLPGPWVYITSTPAPVPVSWRHNKLS